jgi:aspartate-semialdehyde dehydrogenase
MLKVLEERNFPLSDLRLFSSPRSAGDRIATPWGEVTVEDLANADPTGIDIALFSAGAARSRDFAPRFASSGAVVVDNSSAFRMDPGVPLVVADVNDHALATHQGIIANPNCTTMTLMMAAGPLHRAAGLKSMVATSYQSVSGTGQKAIEELTRQVALLGKDSQALISGGWEDPGGEVYVRPIGWNVIPFAGSDGASGYTDEEWKLVNESRKILEIPELRVEPTCVRVPVMVGHGLVATLRFSEDMSVSLASEVLGRAAGVQLWTERVPTPLDSAGIDDVLVGRLRPTIGELGGISLWAVGDNLRKGAALNAVQIAERLLG